MIEARAPAGRLIRGGLRGHLAFTAFAMLALLGVFSLLRLALVVYNRELIGDASAAVLAEGFFNGLRFDLRVVVLMSAPLILAVLSPGAAAARRFHRGWLTVTCSLALLIGIAELDFYREFHQRLNDLVFQYAEEDPRTVASMLWHGFPVARYGLLWAAGTWAAMRLFRFLDHATRPPDGQWRASAPSGRWLQRGLVFLVCLVLAVMAGRGTLRQGPPLRWGDAFTTDSVFVNHLGLNGVSNLFNAAASRFSAHRDNRWKATMPDAEATRITREMLVAPGDRLLDAGSAAVRREYRPPADRVLPVRNVVVILLESFAGHFVGALGGAPGITPNFDRLADEGLLFRRFFSNGTHTHQGMFATMACFPNLPGFEYLMQMPEGGHDFSGLPQLLGARDFDDLYVYNGDFAWDNQAGFFANQGMTRFIGRNDFVAPVVSDPTWGVSDQDMFDRAAEELARQQPGRPFYALLQTLSNHTPYALPATLPVEPVVGHGSLDDHLTAMRYSDWALGRFFERARQAPYFKDTLFVIVGDHGFAADLELTEIDLVRFHVPLLLIGPGVKERFGAATDVVGAQTDVVPTIMGRFGSPVRHQCWGRDLLALPADDPGFAVIKPSGDSQIVAMVEGDRILVRPKGMNAKLYRYRLGAEPMAEPDPDPAGVTGLERRLGAFLQTATRSLLNDTAGVDQAR